MIRGRRRDNWWGCVKAVFFVVVFLFVFVFLLDVSARTVAYAEIVKSQSLESTSRKKEKSVPGEALQRIEGEADALEEEDVATEEYTEDAINYITAAINKPEAEATVLDRQSLMNAILGGSKFRVELAKDQLPKPPVIIGPPKIYKPPEHLRPTPPKIPQLPPQIHKAPPHVPNLPHNVRSKRPGTAPPKLPRTRRNR